jgi:hypothetical protein
VSRHLAPPCYVPERMFCHTRFPLHRAEGARNHLRNRERGEDGRLQRGGRIARRAAAIVQSPQGTVAASECLVGSDPPADDRPPRRRGTRSAVGPRLRVSGPQRVRLRGLGFPRFCAVLLLRPQDTGRSVCGPWGAVCRSATATGHRGSASGQPRGPTGSCGRPPTSGAACLSRVRGTGSSRTRREVGSGPWVGGLDARIRLSLAVPRRGLARVVPRGTWLLSSWSTT